MPNKSAQSISWQSKFVSVCDLNVSVGAQLKTFLPDNVYVKNTKMCSYIGFRNSKLYSTYTWNEKQNTVKNKGCLFVGWMFLLVRDHPGCPGQNPESRKTVVCVYLCVCVSVCVLRSRQGPRRYMRHPRRTRLSSWKPVARLTSPPSSPNRSSANYEFTHATLC